jgi:shikimate kinase
MGRPFHDTDQMVEARAGRNIARIFAEDGEPAFRAMESSALDELAERSRAGELFVAATGGGVVVAPRNVAVLRDAGLVVWLSAPVDHLRERIDSDPASAASRPSLRGVSARDEVEVILGEREPLYRAAAHREVAVQGASIEEIVAQILLGGAGSDEAGKAPVTPAATRPLHLEE